MLVVLPETATATKADHTKQASWLAAGSCAAQPMGQEQGGARTHEGVVRIRRIREIVIGDAPLSTSRVNTPTFLARTARARLCQMYATGMRDL